jgi:hypothetical protein
MKKVTKLFFLKVQIANYVMLVVLHADTLVGALNVLIVFTGVNSVSHSCVHPSDEALDHQKFLASELGNPIEVMVAYGSSACPSCTILAVDNNNWRSPEKTALGWLDSIKFQPMPLCGVPQVLWQLLSSGTFEEPLPHVAREGMLVTTSPLKSCLEN